jgi:dCTP deaminase
MSILSDKEIIRLCEEEEFISPFVRESVRYVDDKKVISFGPSSYGYDFRLSREFLIFSNATQSDKAYIDPKDFDKDAYIRHEGDSVIIPPNGFILATSLEYIKMPKDITGVVVGKSTYARVGCNSLATPIEAGFEGNITWEFANCTPRPIKMFSGEGCVQILFFRGEPCMTTYADRGGKYMYQRNVTLPYA